MGIKLLNRDFVEMKKFGGFLWTSLLFLLLISQVYAVSFTISDSSPTVNQRITITASDPFAFDNWDITESGNGIDYEIMENGQVITMDIYRYYENDVSLIANFSGNARQVIISGDPEGGDDQITITKPAVTITVNSLASTSNLQGILPYSQLTEIYHLDIAATGIPHPPSDWSASTNNTLLFQEIDIKTNRSEWLTNARLYSHGRNGGTFNINEAGNPDPGNNYTLMSLTSFDNNTITLAGDNITTTAANIYISDEADGQSKDFFVAITTNGSIVKYDNTTGTQMSFELDGLTANSSANLINFDQFISTDTTVEPTINFNAGKMSMAFVFRISNMINVNDNTTGAANTEDETAIWGAFGHAVGINPLGDITNWVSSRFQPDWVTANPTYFQVNTTSRAGLPILGGSNPTPVFGFYLLGGTPDNPAHIEEMRIDFFTRNWIDTNNNTGLQNFLKPFLGNDIFSGVQIYKDDGDGFFNPNSDALITKAANVPAYINGNTSTTGGNTYNFTGAANFQLAEADNYSGNAQQQDVDGNDLFISSGCTNNFETISITDTNGGLDPYDETASAFFVVLRSTLLVDDSDTFIGGDTFTAPIGSSFHTLVDEISVEPDSIDFSGNGYQLGHIANSLETFTSGNTALYSLTNDLHIPATLFNMASVSRLTEVETFPYYADFADASGRSILSNFTPEGILGVDLVGTLDTVAKSFRTDEQGNNYLYQFNGLNITLADNTTLSKVANLSQDMLSGFSLWKDDVNVSATGKGYWNGTVDLILDEDGTETDGAGIHDYSQDVSSANVYVTYSQSNSVHFMASSEVYFEDVDGDLEYTLGESLFIDNNDNGQYDSAADSIIYNKQQIDVKVVDDDGMTGENARLASTSRFLVFVDLDNDGYYDDGEHIYWDHDQDDAFDAPTEAFIKPGPLEWENREISTTAVVDSGNNIYTINLAGAVWNANDYVDSNIEFASGNYGVVLSNTTNSVTFQMIQGDGGSFANGETFWILFAKISAAVGQDVYDSNFPGDLGADEPSADDYDDFYNADYYGFDYFLAARPIYGLENLNAVSDNLTIRFPPNGLLLDSTGSQSMAISSFEDTIRIYPPVTISQAGELDTEIGVNASTSQAIAILDIDIVSDVFVGSSANNLDNLEAINIEVYNRGGFSVDSDLEDLLPSDNPSAGIYSGLSLYRDNNTFTSNLFAGLSSSNTTAIFAGNNLSATFPDPNGARFEYLTLTNSAGEVEIVGYLDMVTLGGNSVFLSLFRGAFDTDLSTFNAGDVIVAGRNGVFDENVDVNIQLEERPYKSAGLFPNVSYKFDVDTNQPAVTIPINNEGDNRGPDFFVCMRTVDGDLAEGDTFAVSLVQWGRNGDFGPGDTVGTTSANTDNSGATAIFTSLQRTNTLISYMSHGKTENITVDKTPPQVVSDITAQRGDEFITLQWTEDEDDVSGTLVVRSTNIQDSIEPDVAVEYFQNTFLNSKVISEDASSTSGSNVMTVTSVTSGALATLSAGDFVVIRSGINEGNYTVTSVDAGSGNVGLSQNLSASTQFAFEGGDDLVVAATDGEAFADQNLVNGDQFNYILYAYDNVFNYSTGESITAVPLDEDSENQPDPVTGLTTVNGQGSAIAEWTNPNQTDLEVMVVIKEGGVTNFTPVDGVGYIENESVGNDAAVTLVQSITANQLFELTISATNGVELYIDVYTRNSDFTYSTVASVTATPSNDVIAPPSPIDVKRSSTFASTVLTWDHPTPNDDVSGYILLTSTVESEMEDPNLLSDGRQYLANGDVENYVGSANVLALLTNSTTSYTDARSGGPFFYRLYSYDVLPNYSNGVKPTQEEASITITELSTLSDNLQLRDFNDSLTPQDITVVALDFNMRSANEGFSFESFQLTESPAGSANLADYTSSLVQIYTRDDDGNAETLVASGTLSDSISSPISVNVVDQDLSIDQTYSYLLQVVIDSDDSTGGDNFQFTEITVNGTGEISGDSISKTEDLSFSPNYGIGVGELTVNGASHTGEILKDAESVLSSFSLTATDYESVSLDQITFSATVTRGSNTTSENLLTAMTNIYRDADGDGLFSSTVDSLLTDDTNFYIDSVNSSSSQLVYTIDSTDLISAGTTVNWFLVGTPGGNTSDVFNFSVDSVEGLGVGSMANIQVNLASSLSQEAVMTGDNLSFDFTSTESYSSNILPSNLEQNVIYQFTLISGNSNAASFTDIEFSLSNNSEFDPSDDFANYVESTGSVNVYLYRDRDPNNLLEAGDGAFDSSDNLIGGFTVTENDLAQTATLTFDTTGLVGNMDNLTFDNETGDTYPRTGGFLLVASFSGNNRNEESFTIEVTSASANFIDANSMDGGELTIDDPANSPSLTQTFVSGTANVQNLVAGTDAFYSTSTNVAFATLDITAENETITFGSITLLASGTGSDALINAVNILAEDGTILGTGTYINDVLTIDMSSASFSLTAGSTETLTIEYDFSSSVDITGDTYAVAVSAFSWTGQNGVSDSIELSNLTSGTLSPSASSLAVALADGFSTGGNTLATASDIPIFDFVISRDSSLPDDFILESFTLTADSSVVSSALSNIKAEVFKDGTSDLTLTGNSFSASPSTLTVTFDDYPVEASANYQITVTADVSGAVNDDYSLTLTGLVAAGNLSLNQYVHENIEGPGLTVSNGSVVVTDTNETTNFILFDTSAVAHQITAYDNSQFIGDINDIEITSLEYIITQKDSSEDLSAGNIARITSGNLWVDGTMIATASGTGTNTISFSFTDGNGISIGDVDDVTAITLRLGLNSEDTPLEFDVTLIEAGFESHVIGESTDAAVTGLDVTSAVQLSSLNLILSGTSTSIEDLLNASGNYEVDLSTSDTVSFDIEGLGSSYTTTLTGEPSNLLSVSSNNSSLTATFDPLFDGTAVLTVVNNDSTFSISYNLEVSGGTALAISQSGNVYTATGGFGNSDDYVWTLTALPTTTSGNITDGTTLARTLTGSSVTFEPGVLSGSYELTLAYDYLDSTTAIATTSEAFVSRGSSPSIDVAVNPNNSQLVTLSWLDIDPSSETSTFDAYEIWYSLNGVDWFKLVGPLDFDDVTSSVSSKPRLAASSLFQFDYTINANSEELEFIVGRSYQFAVVAVETDGNGETVSYSEDPTEEGFAPEGSSEFKATSTEKVSVGGGGGGGCLLR